MTAFFRFPPTPHLAWLGAGRPRNDKVLSDSDVRTLLHGDVFVEEKMDGANLGFSVDTVGELRAQNRGTYLDLDALHGQWKTLRRWLASKRAILADALYPNLMLFGDWCYAVHTVRYNRLPDWFLAFDVYDREGGEFWSVARRNGLVRGLDLSLVPELGAGHFTVDSLKPLLSRSQYSDGPPEGLYVRKERANLLVARAKVVSPLFIGTIKEHWSKRRIETNMLAPATCQGYVTATNPITLPE